MGPVTCTSSRAVRSIPMVVEPCNNRHERSRIAAIAGCAPRIAGNAARTRAEDRDEFEDEDGCPDADNDAVFGSAPSGGIGPVSVTVHKDLVYVLNKNNAVPATVFSAGR